MFSSNLGKKLDKFHLLKHPFYQVYWNEGKLTREIIKDYAEQYYQHVKAFPRYISATRTSHLLVEQSNASGTLHETQCCAAPFSDPRSFQQPRAALHPPWPWQLGSKLELIESERARAWRCY